MLPRRRRAKLWSPIPVAIISESDWAGESRLAGFASTAIAAPTLFG